MTAIRDRQSAPDADEVAVPWDERPVVGDRRGLPWWGAVLLAFGLAIVGAIVDVQIGGSLGWLFYTCYVIGSLAAICAVQRRSLFGPMVQPPLILAVTVPGVVLLVSGLPASSDTLAKALAVGTPLINAFPTMAITTGFTLAIGIFRIYRERDPKAPVKGSKADAAAAAKKRPPAKGPGRDGASRPGRPARDGAPGREGGRRDREAAAAAREGAPRRDEAAAKREGAARGRRPAEGRPQPPRKPAADQHPSLPLTPRRPRPEDPPRRGERGGEPGARERKPPPPGARRPRPPEGERRRGGEDRGSADDRPRRMPPRGDGDPRGGQGDPRRFPGRRGNPPQRGRRPWDGEE